MKALSACFGSMDRGRIGEAISDVLPESGRGQGWIEAERSRHHAEKRGSQDRRSLGRVRLRHFEGDDLTLMKLS